MGIAQTATEAAEQLTALPRCLEAHEDFGRVLAALNRGEPAEFAGVWGSACALAAAALVRHSSGPLVVVCPRQDDIDDFCDDFSLFSSTRCERFPAWESDPREQLVHDEIYGDRLRTLKLLTSGQGDDADSLNRPAVSHRDFVVVTSIQSLLQPVPSRDTVAGHSRLIRVGDPLDREALREWLVRHRFHVTTAVELPGEFAARGGIIDIFAPDWEAPVRIELFGDQVESIRRFDVSTQRSLESLLAVDVTVLAPSGNDREHLTGFLPETSWLMLVEIERLAEEAQRYLSRVECPEQLHSHTAVMQQVARFPHVTAAGIGSGTQATTCRFEIESVQRFSGDVSRVRPELEQVAGDQQIHVVAQTDAEVQRLREIFRESPVAAEGRLQFHVGRLREGFRLVRDRTVVISGGEMFHRTELARPSRRRLGKVIDSFLDLKPGDLVVHLAHGIGRYRGLKPLDRTLDGRRQVEEHLEIEFYGGTKVFVPASKIDLVQKYVGGRKSRPTLARIGGKTWVRQKQAAQAAVTDMAADLLQLQAARSAKPGISQGPDTDWQRAFDASFPYHETPDQLAAITAIKADMHSAQPMDRLLCGDVGFGKTELAIRAAFKAIDNGYQIAVLVPTTILAEQHYRTFRDRMSEFPFEIARLSRFCTARQQRDTLEALAAGRIDLVIGTHRLTSNDVQFANLGLVIIDEEQRFGVELKERLKALRTSVDVLTMTATPIPRTLHFSLVGLRDISNLQTPPEDRLAVETRVARFDEKLIRHAILRELSRGGQVYFVHNRVHDIEPLAERLRRIVPEATLRIGHGQMPEHQLEKVMVDFVAGQFDLLLATTIVESGLDIPNANTIFIDEADRYGLADLHQLRGRVGRYKHRAYCYLLIDPRKNITPNAAKRLRAIEEFSDMGAGFAIAMRDLEIRGAGNILGTEQSGHIAAVGYELYCQLLEAAVRRLKRLPAKMVIDVDIDLPGEAYIPDDYVPDMRMKIDLYRRLTRVSTDEDLSDFRVELHDRFGAPPPTAVRMLSLAELKLEAALWQINRIHQEDQYLVFGYSDRSRIDQLSRKTGGKLRVVDGESAYLTLSQGFTQPDEIINIAKSVLQTI
jgi:transcription-repair coupling factor (superfamily II helicase)